MAYYALQRKPISLSKQKIKVFSPTVYIFLLLYISNISTKTKTESTLCRILWQLGIFIEWN